MASTFHPAGNNERFTHHFPRLSSHPPNTPAPSLGEGDTPLVTAPAISRETGAEVWLKLEGCNPTGSFKDRGMVVAVAKVVEEKARAVKCSGCSISGTSTEPISNL